MSSPTQQPDAAKNHDITNEDDGFFNNDNPDRKTLAQQIKETKRTLNQNI